MRDLVNLAITETNVAYQASGINAELELVHAYREPNYVEANNNAFDKALDDITFDDGSMGIDNKRAQYGADIVAFLIDDYQYCGIAWVGPDYGYMFSVTGYNCATGSYVFGHEVGHNMGCWHDRGTDNRCNTNIYGGYEYGWRDPDGGFGTIMSYGCSTGECDNNPSNGCETIQRFSSSTVQYNGKALGDSLSDCARQHNDVRVTVAGYFDDATTPAPEASSTPAPEASSTPAPEASSTPAPEASSTPAPVSSPVASPTPNQPSCSDASKWKVKRGKGKGCGWVYMNANVKRCNTKSKRKKAKFACPIACRNEKNCEIPQCLNDSEWEPNSGSFNNCGSLSNMKGKRKKKACAEIGTDKETFGYEACRQCGRCKR